MKYPNSMIDSLVEPYENAIQLLCTNPEADLAARSRFSLRLLRIGHNFQTPNVYAAELAGLPVIMSQLARRNLFGAHVPASTLNLRWYKLPMQPGNPTNLLDYRAKYEHIMKRRGKKGAIIAVVLMILTAIYHMLSTGGAWNLTDLYKIDMPEPLKNKQKEKAVKRLGNF